MRLHISVAAVALLVAALAIWWRVDRDIALAYVRERHAGLEVFLGDPDVPIDTNHLERAPRAIPMGRRNWLFCSTEVGARHAGIVQSLIVTCRLHGIDPYTYFMDVLQRVSQHPAACVDELTPRMWKQYFAHARCARACTPSLQTRNPARQQRYDAHHPGHPRRGGRRSATHGDAGTTAARR